MRLYYPLLNVHTLQAVASLNNTEGLLESLGLLLTNLDSRLDSLQAQVEANLRDLATARELTSIATRVANQTEVVGVIMILYGKHVSHTLLLVVLAVFCGSDLTENKLC